MAGEIDLRVIVEYPGYFFFHDCKVRVINLIRQIKLFWQDDMAGIRSGRFEMRG